MFTFVLWRGGLYVPKSGVCIGSCVAPIISDIVLGYIDRQLEMHLEKLSCGVFRYVDSFILINSDIHPEGVDKIMTVFRQHGMGLDLTFEVSKSHQLQLLNLRLTFGKSCVC